jgi:hypothetical protein
VSPAHAGLTEWLRLFAVSSKLVSADQAKALRAVLRVRGFTVTLRVTDGEWHVAETFHAAHTARAVVPAMQRCLSSLLHARQDVASSPILQPRST